MLDSSPPAGTKASSMRTYQGRKQRRNTAESKLRQEVEQLQKRWNKKGGPRSREEDDTEADE